MKCRASTQLSLQAWDDQLTGGSTNITDVIIVIVILSVPTTSLGAITEQSNGSQHVLICKTLYS